MLIAVDGDRKNGDAPDEFRIKIWDLSSGAEVYDNMMGGGDSPSGTALGGGSIVIHK